MAYNLISYNLGKYNLSGQTVFIEFESIENIEGSAIPSSVIYPVGIGSEKIDCKAEGQETKFVSGSGLESVTAADIKGVICISLPVFTETVTREAATITETVFPTQKLISETVTGSAGGDLHYWIKGDVTENITASAAGISMVFLDAIYQEDITGSAVDPILFISISVIGDQMCYNLIHYNAGVYNTSGNGVISEIITGEAEVQPVTWILQTSMEETIDSEVNADPLFWCKGSGAEVISADTDGARKIFPTVSYSEIVDGSVRNWIMMLSVPSIAETVSKNAIIAETVSVILSTGEEIISGTAVINESVFVSEHVFSEIISAVAIHTTKAYPTVTGMELITAAAGVISIEEKVCSIEITLQPGQVLVIDAGAYTVYLDDEPVVWTHSGDWIDKLNRDTLSIDVVAAKGSSALETSIIYTERYL